MAREIKIQIDDRYCLLCRRCQAAKACKVRAIINIDPYEAPYIDQVRCYDCRLCLPACPNGAISVI